MKTIWKFPIHAYRTDPIALPAGAQILHVDRQNGDIYLWALVDPSQPDEKRTFEIFGTGHRIDDSPRTHIGTVLIGTFVWHVFERVG